MPRNNKPRKAYRPRAVARPVLEKMRRDLILPAYAHLDVLIRSSSVEEQSDAMSTIVTLVNYMSQALLDSGKDFAPVDAAKVALLSIIERHKRHGVYRPTGGELEVLRQAVWYCDETLPYLDTRRLTDALLHVDKELAKMGVTE